MSTPWWTGLAATTVEIACGPHTHHLHWSDGVLSAPGHPDSKRERALIALGGRPAACLRLVDGWLRHSDDLDVLLFAGRGPGDDIAAYEHAANDGNFGGLRRHRHSGGQRGWTMFAPVGTSGASNGTSGDVTRGDDLERLLRLGGGLPDRLVATVIARWADRIEAGEDLVAPAAPRLQAALYGRLMHTIRSWRGSSRHFTLVMAPAGTDGSIARVGELIQVTLPFSWLRDVWVRGIATTLGRLCLSAAHDGDTWQLSVVDLVDHDLGQTHLMTISLS